MPDCKIPFYRALEAPVILRFGVALVEGGFRRVLQLSKPCRTCTYATGKSACLVRGLAFRGAPW